MFPKFLTSSTYPLQRTFFLLPRFFFGIIGLNLEADDTWPIILLRCFSFLNLFLTCCSSLYYGFKKLETDIPTGLDAICPHTTGSMCFVKISCVWYFLKEIRTLIKRLRNALESQNSEEKIKIKRRYDNIAMRLVFTTLLFSSLTCTVYLSQSDFKFVFQYIRGQPVEFITPFCSEYPEVFLRMPLLPLTIICSHWYGAVSVFSFIACDGLFCSFCYYVASLLKLIAIDLKATLKEYTSLELRDREEKEVICKLKIIIERYNEIADLTERFSGVMGVLVLGHFFSASVVIGISVFNMMMFRGYGIILFLFYTIAVICESFLYCIGGTEIMDSSAELATVAYCSAWYTHSPKVQKMVLTLLTRTQQSLIIKVPFFAPSLPVLTSILKTTGSIIALANSLIQ